MKKSAKESRTYVYKAATLQILSSLMSEHQWIDLVAHEHKEHKVLLDRIKELGINDQYEKLSIKELSQETGYKTAVVTRVIRRL